MGSRLCGRAHPGRPSGRGCPPCSLPPWQPGPARTSARPQPELAAAACSTSFLDSSLVVCAISPCAQRPALDVLPSKASTPALCRGHVGCRRARRSVCDSTLGGNACRLIGIISRARHMASAADRWPNSDVTSQARHMASASDRWPNSAVTSQARHMASAADRWPNSAMIHKPGIWHQLQIDG